MLYIFQIVQVIFCHFRERQIEVLCFITGFDVDLVKELNSVMEVKIEAVYAMVFRGRIIWYSTKYRLTARIRAKTPKKRDIILTLKLLACIMIWCMEMSTPA